MTMASEDPVVVMTEKDIRHWLTEFVVEVEQNRATYGMAIKAKRFLEYLKTIDETYHAVRRLIK